MIRHALAGAAILWSMTAAAALAAPTPLSTRWTIDTSKVPAHVDLVKGRSLLAAPLLPGKLVTIDSAAVAAPTGQVEADAGGQFVRYVDGTGQEVYCSSRTIDRMTKGGPFVLQNGYVYICLVDRDRDGKFDAGYRTKSAVDSELPIMALGKTAGWTDIAPVGYSTVDPATFDVPLGLIVRWDSGSGAADRIGFRVAIADMNRGWGRDSLPLSVRLDLAGAQLPGSFDFADLRAHVASTAPKSASVEIERLAQRTTLRMTGLRAGFARE